MDTILFHPKVVHVPMALGMLMPLVASGVLLAWWRKWLPARAWLIVVLLQAVLLGSGGLALQSGEAEEERVESVVSERYIERHEEAAEVFVLASAIVLGVMGVGMVGIKTRIGLGVSFGATLGTLVVLGLGYQTGKAGGALVYEHGAAGPYFSGATSDLQTRMPQDDDEDSD